MLQYENFEIRFSPSVEGIHEINISSPAGKTKSTFQMPFKGTALQQLLHDLSHLVGNTNAENSERGIISRDRFKADLDLKKIGALLFDHLFNGECLSKYDDSVKQVLKREKGLRIKLYMDPSDDSLRELSRLPWELMYRSDTMEFLSHSKYTTVVRYLEVPRPLSPIIFHEPLRILVVISNPTMVASLDLSQERHLIEESLGGRLDIQVDYLETPTIKELQDQLRVKDYHVFHFMGHGDFNEQTGEGTLIFEKEDGSPDLISGDSLGVLFGDEPSLRVVLLNACKTAQDARQIGQHPFAGVAPKMIMEGIPVVIAMQFPISDQAAIMLADHFYKMLPDFYPVDYIVAEARKSIFQFQRDSIEWATPILFMQAPDGIIFESTFKLKPIKDEQLPGYELLSRKVNNFWIKGKLNNDIPIHPPLILTKELVPEAIKQVWEEVIDLPEPEEKAVSDRVSLSSLFDQLERSLLILGEPGHGKSVTLLLLAAELIRRYELDSSYPIPVVLFLSNWSREFTSIKNWIVKEIAQFYMIKDAHCEEWLQSGRLLLMMDDLDKVSEQDQDACVKALNNFIEEQRNNGYPIGIVVCCREKDYLKLSEKFHFKGAIKQLPLNKDQILEYLERAELTELQKLMEPESELWKEAKSPLILNMMTKVFQEAPEELLKVTNNQDKSVVLQELRQLLAEKYIDIVFKRKGKRKKPYPREMTIRYLSWLATQMKKHKPGVFLMEGLQPSWLTSPLQRVANMALYSLILGSILGLVFTGIWHASHLVDEAEKVALDTQSYWWFTIPIWTFFAVLWDSWKPRSMKLVSRDIKMLKKILILTANIFVYFLIFLGLWLFLWSIKQPDEILTQCLADPEKDCRSLWLSHPIESGIFLIVLYSFRVSLKNHNNYVGASESLKWSWSRSFHGLIIGLVGGLIVWVIFYVIQKVGGALDTATIWRELKFYVPLSGMVGWLFGGLKMGLAKITKTKPNEGIRLSLRNGLFGAAIIGPVIGIGVIPIMHFFLNPELAIHHIENIPWTALWVGLMAAIIAFLWFGGFDAIRHYALRVVISFSQKIPINLSKFLDHAAELILLQKVGGGYVFQNSLLLDHFNDYVPEKGEQETI